MRILDRYTLDSVIKLFFSCLIVFFLLYMVVDIFSHLDEILRNKVDFVILVKYYASFLPIIFVQVSPISCLLATLYTFWTLNRNNEIIAMRASGLSIFQIIKGIIIFGFIVSVFVFWVNDALVPEAYVVSERAKYIIESGSRRQEKKEPEIYYNLSMYGAKNRLFFVNKFDAAKNTMEGINILEHDAHQNITKKIVAHHGAYKDRTWKFYQSLTYFFDLNGQIKDEPAYLEEEIMPIPESPQDFLNQRQKPEFMTIAQLKDYIEKLSLSGATSVLNNLNITLFQRYADPLTNVIIMLLGIPFSLIMRRKATGLSSIGISIMLGFFYYLFNAVSIALGRAGILFPLAAVLLPHTLALSFAIYNIRKQP